MHWKLVSFTRKVLSPCAYWSQARMIMNSYLLHHQCYLGNKYLPHAYISSLQPCVGCLLAWLKKKRTKVYRVVTRLNRSAQTDQNSAEKWNILTRGAIQNLSDLHRVEKEIAKIHTPTRKETETMRAYKKVAKATIATLEKRRDSQAKVETAGTP